MVISNFRYGLMKKRSIFVDFLIRYGKFEFTTIRLAGYFIQKTRNFFERNRRRRRGTSTPNVDVDALSLDGLSWPWPFTFDLQNLIRSLLKAIEVLSKLFKPFMKYRGNKIVDVDIQIIRRAVKSQHVRSYKNTRRILNMKECEK